MKVGIYGGTFDPPHLGHMRAAQAALAALELDELIFIPAKCPPHKPLSGNSAPEGDRLAMTRLMADGMGDPRVSVSSMELEREGKSYTADTLRRLRADRPGDEFFLLMGSDMFLTVQNWYDPQTVMELATLIPFARTGSDREELFHTQSEYLARTFGARTTVLPLSEVTELSSTSLREGLASGEMARQLWCQVYGYILLHGLYGVERDLAKLSNEELRAASYAMVKAKRIPHIAGCEKEAVKLAQRWGADVESCRRAAILHDCTKYLEPDEHRLICARYGVTLDALEEESVKLLHSKTGAALARHVFGEGQAVYDAIFYHTTGRADMSLMEKILYTADYMEETRSFPEVAQLRALAYSDLDGAVLLGAALAIEEMKEKGRKVHPNTTNCHAQLKQKRDNL